MHQHLPQTQNPKRGFIGLLAITIFFLILHSALVFQWSARQGRLALPVYYDDNHTLVDGAWRLEIWQHEGALALVRDYVARPPHAPGHSAIAAVSFALFGLHEWAPYLTNILFLGFVLYSLYLALGEIDWRIRANSMILLLSTPIAGLSILEFRSEVDVAALGTLGVILFMSWSLKSPDPKTLIASAICFSGCFLIKPAVFPYTLGLMGLCLLFHPISSFINKGEVISYSYYFTMLILFFGIAFLFPLPHYILDWRHITSYIQSIAFTPSSLWLRHDNFLSGLQFHVTGYPGRIMLGHLQKPLLITIIAYLILSRRHKSTLKTTILSLIYFTIGAYIGVAINPMNQNYFGMTFHWLLLITSISSMAGILSLVPVSLFYLSLASLTIISISLFFGFKFPLSIDFYREKANNDKEIFSWLQSTPKLVMEPIQQVQRPEKNNILIAATSIVNGRTLEWYSIKNRMQFTFLDFFGCNANEIDSHFQWADFIIVPEPHTPSLEYVLPSAGITGNIIDKLNHNEHFTLLDKIKSPRHGPGYCIYQKR